MFAGAGCGTTVAACCMLGDAWLIAACCWADGGRGGFGVADERGGDVWMAGDDGVAREGAYPGDMWGVVTGGVPVVMFAPAAATKARCCTESIFWGIRGFV